MYPGLETHSVHISLEFERRLESTLIAHLETFYWHRFYHHRQLQLTPSEQEASHGSRCWLCLDVWGSLREEQKLQWFRLFLPSLGPPP